MCKCLMMCFLIQYRADCVYVQNACRIVQNRYVLMIRNSSEESCREEIRHHVGFLVGVDSGFYNSIFAGADLELFNAIPY